MNKNDLVNELKVAHKEALDDRKKLTMNDFNKLVREKAVFLRQRHMREYGFAMNEAKHAGVRNV